MEGEKEKCNSKGKKVTKSNTCEECGVSFRKPAHLKQHLQCHSLERHFACPVDDCQSSYKRQYHLNRHLLQHQGKLFPCSVQGCERRFSYQDNMKRHVIELHGRIKSALSQNQHVCPNVGCGKVFKFASRLKKHEKTHVKTNFLEAICSEPGCWKSFSNVEILKVHLQSCHQYIHCKVCGTKQLKKNIKRHMRVHEIGCSSQRIKCIFC
ncbi:hypothetical protein AQUCO_01500194v1 [Aquilegia coerulea]|uniref:C2H2-type domain-containing protein n=1 Tax=Aquilegia coerulea TaxID=218851 RepID=A0A2G5DSK6_AQUCA|nr:hypothetical protein AQUCO_01500194v1 [Aquilegia coerulea]